MKMTTFTLATALAASGIGSAALADDSVARRIELLESEVQALKQSQATEAARSPKLEYGGQGLRVTAPDGSFSLRLHGLAHIDGREFSGDTGTDQFLVRRARPIIEGTAGDFGFLLAYDFGSGQQQLVDAYAEYRAYDQARIRAGKMKVPFSLERLKSSNDRTFVESGMPFNLAPNRDNGIQLYGTMLPQLSYQLGVFNGITDRGSSDGDSDNNKEYVGRLLAQPFIQTDSVLKGLGLGLAGTTGKKDGTTTARQLGTYVSPGQERIFQYLGTAFADGDQTRLAPQAYFNAGRFGFQGEYTVSQLEVRNGADVARLENTAWEAEFRYVLTGEDSTQSGWPNIKRPLKSGSGNWGAWAVGARVGELKIDSDAFPLFAQPDQSVSKASNWGVVLNGYLTQNVRVALDYQTTRFDGGAAGGEDRKTERVILGRLFVKY